MKTGLAQIAGRTRRRLWALRSCDEVGAHVSVRGHVAVENLGRMTLGDGVSIAGTPIATHLVTGPEGILTIGRGVRIGHGCGIVAHRSVHIGDGAVLGAFVMIMDTDFHVAGSRDARAIPAPVTIGAGARIGHRVTVLRNSTIGEGARVAPGSVVTRAVPPFAEVQGVPARPAALAVAGEMGRVERVLAIVASTVGAAETLEVARLVATLPSWDSLTLVNVLVSLESAFGIELSPYALAVARTLGDVVQLVDHAVVAANANWGIV